jgi:hypothetical protein
MTNPLYLEIITNAETGETIERPFTAEEIAEKDKAIAASAKEREELAKRAAIRESALTKLLALGLTEDEIAVL